MRETERRESEKNTSNKKSGCCKTYVDLGVCVCVYVKGREKIVSFFFSFFIWKNGFVLSKFVEPIFMIYNVWVRL